MTATLILGENPWILTEQRKTLCLFPGQLALIPKQLKQGWLVREGLIRHTPLREPCFHGLEAVVENSVDFKHL